MLFSADIEGLLLELVDGRDSAILEPCRLRIMHDVFDCIEFTVKALDIAVIVAFFLVVLPGLKPFHQFFVGCKSKFVHIISPYD